jgi:gas vesicle protein
MSKRDWIEVGVSLLSGAGIGAALMYLFDPDSGDERRERVADRAGDYASAAGETLGAGWEHISEGAQNAADHARSMAGSLGDAASDQARYYSKRGRRLGSSFADTLRGYGSNIADYATGLWSKGSSKAGDYADSASDWLDDTSDRARSGGRSAMKRTRRALGYDRGPSAGTVTGVTVGAIGALALGAGLMFLLDPAQGRRRRALLRDKTYSAARRSADYAERTGRHLANRASGMAHDAGSYASGAYSSAKSAMGMGGGQQVDDTTLADRVRSTIGRMDNASGVMCRCENGRVILTGNIPASGVESLVSAVRGIGGVSGVDNQLVIRDSVSSM